jgi:tellurite resistance protein TerC
MPSLPEIVAAIPIIISLIIIEGLLSVDNALAIAAMASHLPGRQKYLALRWGIIGAYAFRGLAMAFAAFIIHNPWLKIVGAAYLIHLMASHFAEAADADGEENDGDSTARALGRGFWSTVLAIELMDLNLSVDNVVAAVAMSPKLWIVCTGVFIGILALRFVAGLCIKLIEKYPILEETAFLLIGYVGVILIVELTLHTDITAFEKFIGICIIVAASMLYGMTRPIQRSLAPILKICRLPLVAYAALSNPVFGLLFRVLIFPIQRIYSLFKKKAPQTTTTATVENET